MAEWHITPDYIINHWTDELLDLMVEKLVERKERETEALNIASGKPEPISIEALAAKSRGNIKVVKHGD